MKDEIKEILDKLGKKSSIYKFQINQGTSFNTDEYEASILLDYITDLQEEIKELKEDKSKMFETAVKNNNKLMDRIYNAIEYLGINEEILETCEIYDVNGIEVYKILQGNKWNEVERAYLDDKPIGSDKDV